jgi:hypothetical protein
MAVAAGPAIAMTLLALALSCCNTWGRHSMGDGMKAELTKTPSLTRALFSQSRFRCRGAPSVRGSVLDRFEGVSAFKTANGTDSIRQ